MVFGENLATFPGLPVVCEPLISHLRVPLALVEMNCLLSFFALISVITVSWTMNSLISKGDYQNKMFSSHPR